MTNEKDDIMRNDKLEMRNEVGKLYGVSVRDRKVLSE